MLGNRLWVIEEPTLYSLDFKSNGNALFPSQYCTIVSPDQILPARVCYSLQPQSRYERQKNSVFLWGKTWVRHQLDRKV